MAIIVVANPWVLTWANFKKTPKKPVDPSDGTSVDALTFFNWEYPRLTFSTVNRQLLFTGLSVITLTPNAQIFQSTPQTAALLSHEQFHYDVGIVTARAFARQLMALRAPNASALEMAQDKAENLHLTRSRLLQRHYDQETHHGGNAHYQKIWKDSMAACLSNPNSLHLQGFWL